MNQPISIDKPTRENPRVPVEISGRTGLLYFKLRTFRDFKKETGYNILRDGMPPDVTTDPELFNKLLAYGLKSHNPEMTEEWLMDNVDSSSYWDLMVSIGKAIEILLPPQIRGSSTSKPEGEESSDPMSGKSSSSDSGL